MKLKLLVGAMLLAGASFAQATNIADVVSAGEREQALVLLETGTESMRRWPTVPQR